FMDNTNLPSAPIANDEIGLRYPQLADLTMSQGIAGSSAGGEFPKFTTRRIINQQTQHVIVKFSGADHSAAVQRWSDLLVCEYVASKILDRVLKITTVSSAIYQHDGRTFLEITRFDRHGEHGRSPVCTLASINAALVGKNTDWPQIAHALLTLGWLANDDVARITLVWWFGELIANTDMHDGNLAFRPGLALAPLYDMLPMMYAPANSGEVPTPAYRPTLPFPAEQDVWQQAATAAIEYWHRCAQDTRISANFRAICQNNGDTLANLLSRTKPLI
ncbi:MAG: HipA domain-containing protein, partial [Sulfuriferula sp.]